MSSTHSAFDSSYYLDGGTLRAKMDMLSVPILAQNHCGRRPRPTRSEPNTKPESTVAAAAALNMPHSSLPPLMIHCAPDTPAYHYSPPPSSSSPIRSGRGSNAEKAAASSPLHPARHPSLVANEIMAASGKELRFVKGQLVESGDMYTQMAPTVEVVQSTLVHQRNNTTDCDQGHQPVHVSATRASLSPSPSGPYEEPHEAAETSLPLPLTIQAIPGGAHWTVCGAQETWAAVANGSYVDATCMDCSLSLYCAPHATLVMCPACCSLSPVQLMLLDQCENDGRETNVVVGLGFTAESLFA